MLQARDSEADGVPPHHDVDVHPLRQAPPQEVHRDDEAALLRGEQPVRERAPRARVLDRRAEPVIDGTRAGVRGGARHGERELVDDLNTRNT